MHPVSRISPFLIGLGVLLILSGCVRRPPEPLRPSAPYPSRTEAPLVNRGDAIVHIAEVTAVEREVAPGP